MIAENTLPRHIAVIMDGNGRWAEAQGLSRSEGHAHGVETLRNVLNFCKEYGIDYLTAYAFSTENWKRPQPEVDALMALLIEYLKVETEKLLKDKIQLRVIGNTSVLPEPVQTALKESISRLAIPEHKRVLTLALSYGGRDEITRAVKRIAEKIRNNELHIDDIDEDLISDQLDTAGLPDPDLLIRTAGEMRLSNFLLWQLSYAELYATEICWPDFTKDEFLKALQNFQSRTRKFGQTESQL